MLALPRVGQEVIVSFQEGDPDQPIITGRVYNTAQVPPGHLPQSKTQMYIKSKTYKGSGYNSIMFDDATNDELFYLQAEKDMETLVKHDQRNTVKNNRTFDVKGTQTTTIGKGRSTTVYTGNDIKNVLSGNLMETVSLLRSTQAKDIFKYAANQIELEVGEQTSITMDNGKILLRFGKSTILMNAQGIWLDGKHIGLQETEVEHENVHIDEKKSYSHRFVLKDNEGKIRKNVAYIIRKGDEIIEGHTDAEGCTEIVYAEDESELSFEIKPDFTDINYFNK